MNAMTMTLESNEGRMAQALNCGQGFRFLLARIGVQPRQSRCPSCNSIVYSRRQKLCGVCEQELPSECLFTSSEARRVECLLRSESRRHRAWLRGGKAE